MPENGAVTGLIEALRVLGLEGEIEVSGRWVKLRGERCAVYVAQPAWPGGYYTTWCDDPEDQTVQYYLDPQEAIWAGLRRAAQQDSEEVGGS